jgi:hypothetical protein
MIAAPPDDVKFGEVELAPRPNGGSHFFIDHTSFCSFATTIAILVAFVGMHTVTAIRAPEFFSTKDEYYKLNTSEQKVKYDIEITLIDIKDGARFVGVNGSLICKDVTSPQTLPVHVTIRRTTLKLGKILTNDYDAPRNHHLTWLAGDNQSSPYDVINMHLDGPDALQVHMTVGTDYTNVAGFMFHWHYSNPTADKFRRSSLLLMSFLVAYMLAIFAVYLRFDAESFTQVLLLIVGISGIVASNPFAYFVRTNAPYFAIADHVLMAVFVSAFRLFLLLQLETLRARSVAPPTMIVGLLAITFGLYGILEGAASYDRAKHMTHATNAVNVVLTTERVRMAMDAFYVAVIVPYVVAAAVMNDGVSPRRVIFFGIVAAVTAAVTVITHIIFVVRNINMYSVMPSILFGSIHLTAAALSIFMLHGGVGPEYAEFNPSKAAGPEMVIELDRLSDTEDDDSEEEDDE